MEISYTLIVALIYVTIISFGLAGLLTSLSTIIQNRKNPLVTGVQLNWILILLIVHFNMTWHAVHLTRVSSWTYYGFITLVLGPIIAYFISNFLAPAPNEQREGVSLIDKYQSIKSPILTMFIAIQAWMLLADRILGRGFVESAYLNFALIMVSFFMLIRNSYKSQQYGVALIWIILIAGITLRSLGVFE